MILKKIKQSLMRCFGKSGQAVEKSNKCQDEINITKYKDLSESIRSVGVVAEEAAKNLSNFKAAFKNEIKPKDPKEKLKKKLELIARRTKTGRIRKKNLKRLLNL